VATATMKPAASALLPTPNLALPWSSSLKDDVLYRRIVTVLLVVFLIAATVVPLISIPVMDRSKAEAIPAQLAKIVIEQRKIKLPPKPKDVPKQEAKPEAKPEVKPELPAEVVKPQPKPVARPVTLPPPKPQPTQQQKQEQAQQQVQQARQRASQSGLMAMQSALAEMQQQSASVSNVVAAAPVLQTGATGDGGKVGSTANRVERSMLTGKSAGSTSGGISTSGLSRDTGGSGGLAQRSTTQVTSPVAGMGGGPGGVAVGGGAAAGAAGVGGGRAGSNPARSDETIRAVLEQSKGSLYAIYNRSLRQNPTLAGKVLFELVIEPSGAVSSCRIVSSELGDADLERKLVARLKLLSFGAASVAQYKSRWEVNFLPSG
jgi:periplasmic protein TonB